MSYALQKSEQETYEYIKCIKGARVSKMEQFAFFNSLEWIGHILGKGCRAAANWWYAKEGG